MNTAWQVRVENPVRLQSVQDGAPSEVRWLDVQEPVQMVPTPDGTRVWFGDGYPSNVPHAARGDFYLDNLTGDLYQLT